MIPRISKQKQSWQLALQDCITNLDDLLRELHLERSQVACLEHTHFPLRVPRQFVARMQINNPADPLLLQVLPQRQENQFVTGFSQDPLNEINYNPIPGVLHKYHGRVLLTLVGQCAINCRYCFRRHFPYQENVLGRSHWPQILDYLRQHDDIGEVILSGGDPLLMPDHLLAQFCHELTNIQHIKFLRIHSRIPVVIAERLSPQFFDWFCGSRLKPVLVIHCNHPQEIDESTAYYLEQAKNNGVHLLNQSVLLKNVNDDATILAKLSYALFAAGVSPYYLHKLDPVQGAAHFMLDNEKISTIYEALQCSLPGYLVPKLVQEQAGQQHKVLQV